jgi:hypothetical protein
MRYVEKNRLEAGLPLLNNSLGLLRHLDYNA